VLDESCRVFSRPNPPQNAPETHCLACCARASLSVTQSAACLEGYASVPILQAGTGWAGSVHIRGRQY
jgi:hypothetical protein